MPTWPSQNGSSAAQAMVSTPSSASVRKGYQSPSELKHPRVSWTITT